MMEQRSHQMVYFNSRDRLIRLDTQMIVYFEADGNYHIAKGADGREKIGIDNLPQWARDFIDKGNTIEQMEKMLNQLYDEFVTIYKHVIIPRKHIMYLTKASEEE